jgi:hypothetical protein
MRTLEALAALMALALGAAADEAGNPTAPGTLVKPTLPRGTPQQQVKALLRQYDEAAADFSKRFQKAVSEAEQERLFERHFPNPDDYAALLVQIAEEHPKDPAAVDALVWAARHSRRLRDGDTPFARASKVLIRDHLASPKIGPFCMVLRYDFDHPASVGVLRQVWRKNPDKKAQAVAGFALAKLLRQRAHMPDSLRKLTPQQLTAWEKSLGKDTFAALQRIDAAAERREAEEILDKLTQDRDYAGAPVDYGNKKVTVGELAGRELFEIRRLQPGRKAPEIEGEDIDGKRFKLSDYRGKVVLLDFWGHW